MRDDDQRHTGLLVDVAQQLEDGVGALGIERGGSLIAQDDLRLAGERASDRHALLLASGELARIGGRLLGQADAVQ